MDSLMFLMKQGDLADRRKIDMLEKRIETLENMVNALQSEQRPRMGRPPKVKDEPAKESQGS
jgi:chaperonin cofactor prefoldin